MKNTINPLSNIRIVLDHTSHPGNIGSAARAMKTMGITRLHLVEPNVSRMPMLMLWLATPATCWKMPRSAAAWTKR